MAISPLLMYILICSILWAENVLERVPIQVSDLFCPSEIAPRSWSQWNTPCLSPGNGTRPYSGGPSVDSNLENCVIKFKFIIHIFSV